MRKTAVALRGGLPAGVSGRATLAGESGPPVVTAAGQGVIAEEILALAAAHGVPVEHDPTLVSTLARLQIGQAIPAGLYQAIAELLVFLYDLDAHQEDMPAATPGFLGIPSLTSAAGAGAFGGQS